MLGKRRDQEEVYCSFGPCDVREASDDPLVPKARLVDIARRLEDFAAIRFIVLTRLAEDREMGQILGLSQPSEVQRGFDQVSTMSTPTKAVSANHRSSSTSTASSRTPEHGILPRSKRLNTVSTSSSSLTTTLSLRSLKTTKAVSAKRQSTSASAATSRTPEHGMLRGTKRLNIVSASPSSSTTRSSLRLSNSTQAEKTEKGNRSSQPKCRKRLFSRQINVPSLSAQEGKKTQELPTTRSLRQKRRKLMMMEV